MRELERESPDAHSPRASGPLSGLCFAIVGAGKVGTAIARGADRAGLRFELSGRSGVTEACGRADVALLCVPDVAISQACDGLAQSIPPLRFVGHVSGATGLDALGVARARGAEVFSLHPLQTIPHGDTELIGTPCAVSGSDAAAEGLATSLAETLGMRPFTVPDESRAAYHAAASIASNFLVALEESAAELLSRAGIDDARELLAPLVLRTAANWAERGGDALTGPIARGDAATVEAHLAALSEIAPELIDVYEALAERTRSLPQRAAGDGQPAVHGPQTADRAVRR